MPNFRAPARGQRGQGMAEYAMILSMIAIAAIVAIAFLGGSIDGLLSSVGNTL